jgi:hypothetical protein
MLISVPITTSEPAAVSTTNGARESSSVWPNSADTSATSATVEARWGRPVTPAIIHAAVAAAVVVAPRMATARHSAG